MLAFSSRRRSRAAADMPPATPPTMTTRVWVPMPRASTIPLGETRGVGPERRLCRSAGQAAPKVASAERDECDAAQRGGDERGSRRRSWGRHALGRSRAPCSGTGRGGRATSARRERRHEIDEERRDDDAVRPRRSPRVARGRARRRRCRARASAVGTTLRPAPAMRRSPGSTPCDFAPSHAATPVSEPRPRRATATSAMRPASSAPRGTRLREDVPSRPEDSSSARPRRSRSPATARRSSRRTGMRRRSTAARGCRVTPNFSSVSLTEDDTTPLATFAIMPNAKPAAMAPSTRRRVRARRAGRRARDASAARTAQRRDVARRDHAGARIAAVPASTRRPLTSTATASAARSSGPRVVAPNGRMRSIQPKGVEPRAATSSTRRSRRSSARRT